MIAEHRTEWGQVCGRSYPGEGVVLCADHMLAAERRYPQGWRYYPGDVCRHGAYVGGMGIDWMCGRCESGEDEESN